MSDTSEVQLTKSEVKTLDQLLTTIDEAKRLLAEGVVTIGRCLSEARDILGERGGFVEWVEENCQFSQRSAYNYIDAFRVFGTFQNLDHLQDSALYLLSKCEPAAAKAKGMANRGKIVTHEIAKQLVDEAKAEAKATARKPPISPQVAPAPAASETSQPVAGPAFVCTNCGGQQADEDGDCVGCHEPAVLPKPGKNGREVVPTKDRTAALKAHGVIERFFDTIHAHARHRAALDSILEGIRSA